MNGPAVAGRVSLDKMKACIVYACSRPQPEHAQLDHVKLNKVLWYSDTAAFMASGRSITGGRYIRKPRGPVAKFMAPAVNELIRDGVVTAGKRFDTGLSSWMDTYEVTGEPEELPELSAEEKAYLDRAFAGACLALNSDAVSERTHGEIWELANDGEEIPLYAMYAEDAGRITRAHIEAAFPA